jgi:hypothetical protein
MSHNHEPNGHYHDGCAACEMDKLHVAPPAAATIVGYFRKGTK